MKKLLLTDVSGCQRNADGAKGFQLHFTLERDSALFIPKEREQGAKTTTVFPPGSTADQVADALEDLAKQIRAGQQQMQPAEEDPE